MKTLALFAPMLASTFSAMAQFTIIDQIFDPPASGAALSVASDRWQIQTFTSGLSGKLSRVDIFAYAKNDTFEPITLTLWSTNSDGLPLAPLSSSTLAASQVRLQGYASFADFSEDVYVTPGLELALVITSSASNLPPSEQRYEWGFGGDYSRGTSFTFKDSLLTANSEDFHFRTYVSTIPEPSSLLLIAAGILFVFFARKNFS